MAAYIIGRINIHDAEGYARYTALSPGIIARHGGRFLVRGGAVETLEGEPFESRLVVLEFPSLEAARTFYASAEYQAAKAIRQPVSDGQFIVVEGA